MVDGGMRIVLERTILNVMRQEGVWRVEHDGREFGHSADREVARAAASRQARQLMDAGHACEVRISGERPFRSA